MKILLDTDIGSDIDDVFALTYLLNIPDAQIMGITTTTGMPQLRARLADAVCSYAGRSIPVYVGCEMPLSGNLLQPKLTKNQNLVAEDCSREYANENKAVDFMRKTIEDNPGEITLICIGPLTNIATLFKKFPHIPDLLGSMVIMGGRYFDSESFDTVRWGETEWNILCDSEAAKIVFNRNTKNCIVAGVEQTCLFSMPSDEMRRIFATDDRFSVVDRCMSSAERVWFHDVLALYSLFYPNEVEFKRGNITVKPDINNERFDTVFSKCDAGKYSVLTNYSCEKFFENFKSVIGIK